MPPRATSKTAVSTFGFWRTIWADFGPDMSPFFVSRPSTTMPSVEVIPTRRPISFMMWAIIRTVVVLPFVPVTAMIGIRDGLPGGKRPSMTGLATYCGSPSVGWVCIRKPGAALTSTIAPPVSRTGVAMSGQMKSMPATSSPTIWAAVSAISTLSGWASIVRSIDVPPVDMLPVRASLTRVPFGRPIVEPEALGADELLGGLVELDPGQDLLVADAAARVLVGDVDELADGVLAVADDARRDALGDRGDLAADDEAAVVVAGDVALDDEVAGAALGEGARGTPCGRPPPIAEVEVDAAAVVAVERLDDARVADARARRRPPRPRSGRPRCAGTGRPAESSSRFVRLLSDAMSTRDAGRPRGHRRPDPLLVDALAELDERVAVEPDVRDVAAGGLVEDRLGRRPERLPLGEQDEPLELGHEVDRDRRVVRGDEVVDEGDGDLAGLDPDVLLAVLVDHVVAAVLAGARGSCRGGRRCRRGSGARGRCARRCGRPTCRRGAA